AHGALRREAEEHEEGNDDEAAAEPGKARGQSHDDAEQGKPPGAHRSPRAERGHGITSTRDAARNPRRTSRSSSVTPSTVAMSGSRALTETRRPGMRPCASMRRRKSVR